VRIAPGFIRVLSQKHKITVDIQTFTKTLQKVRKTGVLKQLFEACQKNSRD
jgi:hypothetical protein